jgi:hypothetical protein
MRSPHGLHREARELTLDAGNLRAIGSDARAQLCARPVANFLRMRTPPSVASYDCLIMVLRRPQSFHRAQHNSDHIDGRV